MDTMPMTGAPPAGPAGDKTDFAFDRRKYVANATIMIEHAMRRGIDLPPDVLQTIGANRAALAQGKTPDDEGFASFVGACTKLAKAIEPATVESIVFSRSEDTKGRSQPKRLAAQYSRWGLAIFFVLIVSQGYWLVLNNFVDDAKRTREALTPYALLMDAAWAELRKELRAHLTVTVTVAPSAPATEGTPAAAPAGAGAGTPAAMAPATTAPATPAATTASATAPTGRGNDGDNIDPPSDDVKNRLITKVQELEAGRGASVTVGVTAGAATPLQAAGPTIHEMFTLKNTLDTDLKFISSMVFSPDTTDRGEGDFRNYFQAFGLAYTDLLSFEKAQYILQLGTRFVLPVVYGLLGAAVFLVRRISEAYRLEYLSPSSPVDFSLRFFLGGVSGLAISWFITSGTPEGGVIASGPSSVIASLSPLVLSFVAGYAVELLFSIIDRIVASFTDKGARRA